MNTPFDIVPVTVIHDKSDSLLLTGFRRRIGYFGAFVWCDFISAESDAGFKSLLGEEHELSVPGWIVGVLTEKSAAAVWMSELTHWRSRSSGLSQAVCRMDSSGIPKSLPVDIPTWDFFSQDAKAAFHQSLLSTLLPLDEIRTKLNNDFLHAAAAMQGLLCRDSRFCGWVVGLRSSIHQALRHRYLYEKLIRQAYPQRKDMTPWQQLRYIRARTRKAYDNPVFASMEANISSFWFECDIRQALAGSETEFVAMLPALKSDMQILCLAHDEVISNP